MQLVSWASGTSEKLLENSYRRVCKDDPSFFEEDQDEMFEEEAEENRFEQRDHEEHDGNECLKLLSTIQRETVFVDPKFQTDRGDLKDADEDTSFPEQDLLDSLLEEQNVAAQQAEKPSGRSAETNTSLPCTLSQAMSEKGDRWNALLRLAIRLRVSKGGMDVPYIKDGKGARRTAANLNWHQCLSSREMDLIFDGTRRDRVCSRIPSDSTL